MCMAVPLMWVGTMHSLLFGESASWTHRGGCSGNIRRVCERRGHSKFQKVALLRRYPSSYGRANAMLMVRPLADRQKQALWDSYTEAHSHDRRTASGLLIEMAGHPEVEGIGVCAWSARRSVRTP